MNFRALLIALMCLVTAVPVHGQSEKKLKPGDGTPKLDIESWFGGSPVAFGQGDVHFMIFMKSLASGGRPMLAFFSALQDVLHLEGVRVVVIVQDPTEVAEDFLAHNVSDVRFTIGVDKRGQTFNSWVGAAKLDERFSAFIVGRNGIIMYLSSINRTENPKKTEEILLRIMRDRYDPRLEPKAAPRMEQARNHRKLKDWRMCEKHYNDVIALDKHVFADVAMEKFELYLVDMNEPDKAYAYAQTLITDDYATDPQFLREFGEMIALDPDIPDDRRRYDVAIKAVMSGLETVAPQHKPRMLDSLAKVYYRAGEFQKAVDTQREAWFSATPMEKEKFKHDLDVYDAALRRSKPAAATP